MPDNLKEVSPTYGQAGSIGAIPILILLAALGTLGFLLISNTFDFKDKLFSTLYLKSSSEAAGKGASPIPTVNPSYTSGWHPPGSHGSYVNNHEHGDAPPQWVLDSRWQPFTQSRESHQGYKGVYVKKDNGVEGYLIAHIISLVRARSHGDHDYQLWIREPDGTVSHWGKAGATDTSVLDFGSPPTQRCIKSGLRPSIEEFNNTEAWYMAGGGARGLVLNVAWLMYGPNESMNGPIPIPSCQDIVPGDGSERDIGWSVNTDVFPGPDAQSVSQTLERYCVHEDKGCMIRFARGRFDYASTPMLLPN